MPPVWNNGTKKVQTFSHCCAVEVLEAERFRRRSHEVDIQSSLVNKRPRSRAGSF